MDKQNSKGCSDSRLHPFAILQHGIEIKKDIQNEIFELIAILKKREHDLCLEVDQQCLELLSEAEELGICGAPVLNYPNHEIDESIQYIKRQDLLTSKLKFSGNFNFCQKLLKNYGDIDKIDCRKNIICKPKINELPERLNEWIKTVQENLKEKKHLNKLEKVSYCSADSFKAPETPAAEQLKEQMKRRELEHHFQKELERRWQIRFGRGASSKESLDIEQDASFLASIFETKMMMDAVANRGPIAESTSPAAVLRAAFNNKTPPCFPLACKKNTNAMQKENEWLADGVQQFQETSTDDKMQGSPHDVLSETSATRATSKSYPGDPASGDNPQSTVKACFGTYLEQNDLRLWLNTNHSSDTIDSTLCSDDTSQSFTEIDDDLDDACRFVITKDEADSFCLIKSFNP